MSIHQTYDLFFQIRKYYVLSKYRNYAGHYDCPKNTANTIPTFTVKENGGLKLADLEF